MFVAKITVNDILLHFATFIFVYLFFQGRIQELGRGGAQTLGGWEVYRVEDCKVFCKKVPLLATAVFSQHYMFALYTNYFWSCLIQMKIHSSCFSFNIEIMARVAYGQAIARPLKEHVRLNYHLSTMWAQLANELQDMQQVHDNMKMT